MRFIQLTFSWTLFWSGIVLILWAGIVVAGNSLRILASDVEIRQLSTTALAKVDGMFPSPTDTPILNKIPTTIEFPDLNHQVGIVPNRIIDGQWQVSETQANYLIGSGVIGEPGNIVIYAHKRPQLFAKLHQLGPGDRIILKSPEVVGEYRVVDARIVPPDNTDILQTSEQKILTLYTCNGWLDEDRLVVKAELVDR